MERNQRGRVFTDDETKSRWKRNEKTDMLKLFCPEGYTNAHKYGHFIIGNGKEGDYIGIPGRFIIEEQPAKGETGFTLWQPIKGGEELYESLEKMTPDVARVVYGYWIARIDAKTLKISEV